MNFEWAGHSIIAYNEKIFVIGGLNSKQDVDKKCEYFDSESY